MTESLVDLLRRTADAVHDPQLDVVELVTRARKRQRRRRLAAVAGATGLVAAIVVGTFAVRGGSASNLEPAPSPSPSPTVVHPTPDTTRPLVYAVGSTVHVGGRSIDANARVMYVDATDDGVVFVTDRDSRLWFDDGSTTESIGRLAGHHLGEYLVHASNPGSLLVWPDGTGHAAVDSADEFVVYDTSRREEVARVPYVGRYNLVLHVDTGQVFLNPDNRTPGCWVYDVQYCSHPHLFRYDVASGDTRKITQAAYEAELRTQARMVVLAEPRGDSLTELTARGEHFRQRGRVLVPTDSNGDDTVFTRTDGERVRLRLPAGYAAAHRDNIGVVQWLDDDRVVLEVDQDPDQIGFGDSYRAGRVDLAVCRLPAGVCRIAVRVSPRPYLAPG